MATPGQIESWKADIRNIIANPEYRDSSGALISWAASSVGAYIGYLLSQGKLSSTAVWEVLGKPAAGSQLYALLKHYVDAYGMADPITVLGVPVATTTPVTTTTAVPVVATQGPNWLLLAGLGLGAYFLLSSK